MGEKHSWAISSIDRVDCMQVQGALATRPVTFRDLRVQGLCGMHWEGG